MTATTKTTTEKRNYLTGYTEAGKTKDGKPIYTMDNAQTSRPYAHIIVNGYPRLARCAGMICTVGIATGIDHSDLI